MPSAILARADALMQRRRQSPEADDVPVLTDAVDPDIPDDDDDVPVLFDIEPIEPLTPLTEPGSPEEFGAPPSDAHPGHEPPRGEFADTGHTVATPPSASTATEDIAHDIARRVEQRLAAELPRIIQAAVHDYLAEQRQASARSTDPAG